MGIERPPDRLEDWLTISLRWLAIFGLTLALSLGGQLSVDVVLALLVAGLWNASLTLLVAFNQQLPVYKYLAVGIDMAFACLLFYLSGGLGGTAGWAGVLPIMTASAYFGLAGGLVAALTGLLLQGVIALQSTGMTGALTFLATLLPLYLVFALVFGLLSQRIQTLLARLQNTQQAVVQEARQSGSDNRRALYQLITAMSASLNYQRVLENALDLSAGALGGTGSSHDRLVSAFLLYANNEAGGTELRVGSARRFTPADMRTSLPGTDGLLGRVIDEGAPQLSTEIAQDAELSRIVAVRACKSAYCLPLRSGLDTYGVLLFAHPKADFFNPDRREVLDVIGNQATIAIQNARLYRDLEQEKERFMQIQEEARNKLARDLHDGPTQTVAAIAMRVNFARRLLDRDPKAASSELFKIEELARRTTKEIRHMLFTLRPLVLESQGLVPALESMAEKMHETYNQDVTIEVDAGVVSQIELGRQGVIFYIAEEAVNNARKHARAAHVWVRLKPAGDELALLEVEDDGVGFDPHAVDVSYESRGSLGLVNLRERAELLNGYLQIDSRPGQGTHVSVVIPLSVGATDWVRRGQ